MAKLRIYYETVRFRKVPGENEYCKKDFSIKDFYNIA